MVEIGIALVVLSLYIPVAGLIWMGIRRERMRLARLVRVTREVRWRAGRR